MTKEEEKAYKAVESFKNFIKSKENEQKTLYENEEFYKDDIEQNELFLKMLHSVLNLIQTIKKKDNTLNKVQEEVRDHIGFENRLKRDNREPDMFNQGRFYVANNINNILKGR